METKQERIRDIQRTANALVLHAAEGTCPDIETLKSLLRLPDDPTFAALVSHELAHTVVANVTHLTADRSAIVQVARDAAAELAAAGDRP